MTGFSHWGSVRQQLVVWGSAQAIAAAWAVTDPITIFQSCWL